jgi:hypothetical protein
VRFRDKESNLDRHVQSVVSCRLDDPGVRSVSATSASSPSVHLVGRGRRSGAALAGAVSWFVTSGRSRTMLSKPLANPSTLDRVFRSRAAADWASYVEELWSPALPPAREKSQVKSAAYSAACFSCARRRKDLSLSGGASKFDYRLFKLSITLVFVDVFAPKRRKATRWVALARAAMRLEP